MTRRRRAELAGASLALLILFIALVNVYPVYQMVMVSIQPLSQLIQQTFVLVPRVLTSINYEKVLFRGGTNFPRFFVNSLLVAGLTTLVSVIISSLGGYSLARLRFPGKGLLDKLILFVYVIPPILLVIPIYVLMVRLKLLDTYISVILAHTLFAIPFGTWLLRGFFKTIPSELEDAALVDGASRLGTLFRIIIPISAPGLVAVSLFSFVLSWDEFLFASLFLNSVEKKTVPIGIYALVGTYGEVRWGEIMAASTLAAVPMFFVFLVLQRWLIQGLSAGAVKG